MKDQVMAYVYTRTKVALQDVKKGDLFSPITYQKRDAEALRSANDEELRMFEKFPQPLAVAIYDATSDEMGTNVVARDVGEISVDGRVGSRDEQDAKEGI